jgi:hypothetical protein
MTQQGKKPGYGNCRAMETRENKLRFPPFPQRLENSPKNVEFPTVTTAPTAGYISRQNMKTRNKTALVYAK